MKISKRALLSKNRETSDLFNILNNLKLIAFKFYSKGNVSPTIKKLLGDLKIIIDRLLEELQK